MNHLLTGIGFQISQGNAKCFRFSLVTFKNIGINTISQLLFVFSAASVSEFYTVNNENLLSRPNRINFTSLS